LVVRVALRTCEDVEGTPLAPSYGQRVRWLEEVLDRSGRTVARRIDGACARLGELLAAGFVAVLSGGAVEVVRLDFVVLRRPGGRSWVLPRAPRSGGCGVWGWSRQVPRPGCR
jgi:hypothetical protein